MGKEGNREREKEARRQSILTAARGLFHEKSTERVTIAQIARKAGLCKGSVYHYFQSKEEIYARVMLADLDTFHKTISHSLHEGSKTAAEMLEDFANIYVDTFLADREAFRKIITFILQVDSMVLSEELIHELFQANNRSLEMIGNIIKRGIDTGEFSLDTDIWQGRNIIWGTLNGIISLYLFTGKEESQAKNIRQLIKTGLQYFIDGSKMSSNNTP